MPKHNTGNQLHCVHDHAQSWAVDFYERHDLEIVDKQQLVFATKLKIAIDTIILLYQSNKPV